jgi:undecaprenyl-diphosphatase
MSDIDIAITKLINGAAGQNLFLDTAMIWISAAGIPLLVLAVACQWWAKTDRQGTRHVLVQAGLAFFLGLGFNQIILLFVDRIRPYAAGISDLLIGPSLDPSFPSDHATAVFAIAMTFAVSNMPKRAVWFGLAALAVALSRVYVGTHYASDVIGGALTGAFAAAMLPSLYVRGTRVDRFITGIF